MWRRRADDFPPDCADSTTGIDISEQRVALLRERIRGAVFVQADMTRFHADPGTSDGVAAFYSLIHLTLGELQPMLSRISSWLRPGGVLGASLGARGAGEHLDVGWSAGAARYWSSYTTTETLRFVQDAGLKVTVQAVGSNVEDGEAAPLLLGLWVIARKRLAAPIHG